MLFVLLLVPHLSMDLLQFSDACFSFSFGGISFSVVSVFAWTKWPYCSVMASSSVQSSAYRLRTVTV